MEEGAHNSFRIPPPGIEFTLTSPKIGIECLPTVDPPWMPQVETKVEEVTIGQDTHVIVIYFNNWDILPSFYNNTTIFFFFFTLN